MDEQGKKAERMIKLSILLCGLLFLVRAGQAYMSRYEDPETYLLHQGISRLALWGKALYLPVLVSKESETLTADLWMEKAADFFGWSAGETSVYTEDDYTRQELIEAGRENSLSAIRRENQLAGADQEEETGETEAEEAPETEEEETEATEEEKRTESSDILQQEEETGETLAETEPDFQTLIGEQSALSYEKLLKTYFVVDPTTQASESLVNYTNLTEQDLSLPSIQEGEKQILIYHTHSQEEFADSVKNDPDTTIVGVGTYLEELLTAKGYGVLHVTDTFDLIGGKVDRNKAYANARVRLQEILEENPSLQVILDIHRDGVAEDKRLVTTIDGRPTAKLMFFNGLSYKKTEGELTGLKNPYIQENLAFSFQTEYLCDYYYPSLSRCIYLKAYRYNLDLLPRSMLVEVGAQTNTVQEAKNAMLCLARVLDKLLQGA